MNQINNRFKRKPVTALLLCFGILAVLPGGLVEARKPVLVLPFKVTPVQEKAHQWLGRAVSYYVTSGLQHNALPVLPDQYTASILEMNHIMFPYHITKASVIRLTLENQLDRVIWGEIMLGGNTSNVTDKSPIQLQSVIINLEDFSQQNLPLIKGNINDLYKINSELLTSVVNTFNPGEQEFNSICYPQFNLNHRSYEIFVKSLLVKESSKRIQLLEKARKANKEKNSDILNFELAKLYFNSGEWETLETYLEKIAADKENPNPLLKVEKTFLRGLMAHAREDISGAVEAFTSLLPENRFSFEVHHNLGVIYLKRENYEAAEKHFRYALQVRKDADTWLNLVHVLLSGGDTQQAAFQLNHALRLYSQKEKLVELFSYFISRSENQAQLFTVFQNYIPDLFLPEALPMASLDLKNPFNLQYQKPELNAHAIESDEIPKRPDGFRGLKTEDIDSWIERLQELLEVNPFEPVYHRLISMLYLRKKEFYQAELHALALIFLEKTRENNLHLLKIYKASGKRKKVKY
jgi:tetratricopeptide (TPR) repeat protein